MESFVLRKLLLVGHKCKKKCESWHELPLQRFPMVTSLFSNAALPLTSLRRSCATEEYQKAMLLFLGNWFSQASNEPKIDDLE